MRLKLNLEHLESSKVSYQGKLARYAESCGWVLCVGAGISDGIFPCWNELAEKLLRQTDLNCTATGIEKFLTCFGPEALIQAAVNATSANKLPGIEKALSQVLYGPLQTKSGDRWNAVAKALSCSKPFNLTMEEWRTFEDIISDFPKASAPAVARVIADDPRLDSENDTHPKFLYAVVCLNPIGSGRVKIEKNPTIGIPVLPD